MAFKFLAELKHIVSVGEALDTLSRLVDYVQFRPLKNEKPTVRYNSMEMREVGINGCAVKLVKFFQEIARERDPSANMYVQLIKQYFLNAFNWSDVEAEGYDDFESDALWFCGELETYLRDLGHEGIGKKTPAEPICNIVLRRRLHTDQAH